MFSFKKISLIAALALMSTASPSFADPNYKLTVKNSTNASLWLTWYHGSTYGSGQAGTACIAPGGSTVGADDAWKGADPTVVRVELKEKTNCGGSTLNSHKGSWGSSYDGQDVWKGHVNKGNQVITVTRSGNSLSAY